MAKRRRKPTPKKGAFLKAFAKVGNVTHAARIAKCNRTVIYDWLDNDPEFARKFEEAESEAVEHLEEEAYRRAVTGTLKPVFHQGIQCGAIREYSDTLLIFTLKARRPEKYRDNVKTEHVGRVGVEHSGSITVGQVADELESKLGPDLEAIARGRFGLTVPGLHGAGTDGESLASVSGTAPRGLNGSGGNGSHQGTNGNGHSGH